MTDASCICNADDSLFRKTDIDEDLLESINTFSAGTISTYATHAGECTNIYSCNGNQDISTGTSGCRDDNSVSYNLNPAKIGNIIYASDFNNLYDALEKEARRRGRSNSFTNVKPSALIYAKDYNQMRNSSVVSVSSVSVGEIIYASKVQSVINAVKNAGSQCLCNCNYCGCDCNVCTCDCNHCPCNGHY